MTSWIIVNKKTGRQIFETYSEETAREVRENHKDTLEAIQKGTAIGYPDGLVRFFEPRKEIAKKIED